MFRALWAYRGFVVGSVMREFQLKYRNSLLGATWNLINPLAMIVVYTVIFSRVMNARLPGSGGTYAYGIFLCAGILTWGLFAEVVGKAQGVFIENANLLKKLTFPRLCLPVVVVLNALLNFLVIFSLFTVFLLMTGHFPGWAYLAVFPLLVLQMLFAIGLGITLGVLNVFFRDVGQLAGILMQFWFWFTPIVYSARILPVRVQSWVNENPMTSLMMAYQDIMLEGQWPQWTSLWGLVVLSLGLCLLGLYLFRRHSGDMVDEL